MPSTGIFNSVIGVDPVSGRSKWAFFDHYGPTSYVAGGEPLSQSVYGGPNPFGLAGYSWVSSGKTNSGNYQVDFLAGGLGNRTKVFLKWTYAGASGQMGVDGVTSTGGSGMTAGPHSATKPPGHSGPSRPDEPAHPWHPVPLARLPARGNRTFDRGHTLHRQALAARSGEPSG